MRNIGPSIGRRLAAIEERIIPPKTRTVVVWRNVWGEDKSEQTLAEMRAHGRLTDQDRVIICSWQSPAARDG
jgi:hypothetical protein